MSLFNPSRDEVRMFFFDAWKKFNTQQALSDLEKLAVSVIHLHPEYHAILSFPERFQDLSYFPEMGETNPFLHMSLHLSILEQISINQPIGIREVFDALKAKHQDEHAALHVILECLGETIWQSQRNQAPLDATHYLQLMRQRANLVA